MGRFGHYVIDADGHGGEPLGWRRRIPDEFKPQMRAYVAAMKARYGDLLGLDAYDAGYRLVATK